jgi:hypothetical protein
MSITDTGILEAKLAQAVAWVSRAPHRANCPLAWLAENHSGFLHKCTCGKAEIVAMVERPTIEAKGSTP